MTRGAPAGITHAPSDPGIFPDCSAQSEISPDYFQCDVTTFANYPGVEVKGVTTSDLQSHVDSSHLAEFDILEELQELVGGRPIFNKFGVTEKIRNDVLWARMILDVEQR